LPSDTAKNFWQILIAPLTIEDAARWLSYKKKHCLIVLAFALLAFFAKFYFMDFESQDYTVFLTDWIRYIRSYGIDKVYGLPFSNYSPLYSYMLGLGIHFFPDANQLYVVKYLTFLWEGFTAYWAWRITALHYKDVPNSVMPITAAMLIFVTPSVITNGAATGQCDIMLAGFMLASLCCIVERKPTRALIFAGLALSFKPQALFLSPLLLVLIMRGDMPWKRIWMIPAVYSLLCIPAWLEGRPLINLLKVYWIQIRGHRLSYNAGNPYLYVNNHKYTLADTAPIVQLGCCFAFLVACYFVWKMYRRWHTPLTPVNCLLAALFFAGLMPYILPLMHDRYFFMADIFSLVLACMRPKWFFITVLFQAASLAVLPPSQMPRLGGIFGWIQSDIGLMKSIGVNLVAILCVYWLCRKHLWNRKPT